MPLSRPPILETRHESNAAQDIIAALALKVGLLLALYVLWFAPHHRPSPDATQTAIAIIGQQPVKSAP